MTIPHSRFTHFVKIYPTDRLDDFLCCPDETNLHVADRSYSPWNEAYNHSVSCLAGKASLMVDTFSPNVLSKDYSAQILLHAICMQIIVHGNPLILTWF